MMDLDRLKAPEAFKLENISLIRPEKKILDNGLEIHVISGGAEDVVKVEFNFPFGNRVENKPLLSNICNYLLNSGTSQRTSVQLMEEIDYYGAFYQNDNQFDRASVSLYTLNKYLPQTLSVIAEILTDPIFPQEELEIYRQNAKQRFLINMNKNDYRARRLFSNVLFGDHPYGIAHELEHYDQITRQDLIEFHQQYYSLSDALIMVSGNIDEVVLSEMNKVFGGLTLKPKQKLDFKQIPHLEPSHKFEERPDALQSAIRIGKQIVNKTHPDFIDLSILTTVLGGYFGSRLMSNIREDKGYTYGIGSGLVSIMDSGFFYIATEVGADVCANALKEIYFEIDRLMNEPVQEEELNLVRNYLMGSYIGSVENIFSHADKFKGLYFYGMNYDYYDKYFKSLNEITPQRLLNLCNQYLAVNTLNEVVVGKK